MNLTKWNQPKDIFFTVPFPSLPFPPRASPYLAPVRGTLAARRSSCCSAPACGSREQRGASRRRVPWIAPAKTRVADDTSFCDGKAGRLHNVGDNSRSLYSPKLLSISIYCNVAFNWSTLSAGLAPDRTRVIPDIKWLSAKRFGSTGLSVRIQLVYEQPYTFRHAPRCGRLHAGPSR